MLRLFAQASRLERSENGVERMTLGKLGVAIQELANANSQSGSRYMGTADAGARR
jgi:hypothetical protein